MVTTLKFGSIVTIKDNNIIILVGSYSNNSVTPYFNSSDRTDINYQTLSLDDLRDATGDEISILHRKLISNGLQLDKENECLKKVNPRKYIFRGYSTEHLSWIYGNFHNYNEETYIESNEDDLNLSYDVEPYTIGQFIGLSDTLNNNIFEGDIVITDNGDKYIVKYHTHNNSYYFVPIECGKHKMNITKHNIIKYDIKVIGNIFGL